MQCCTDLIKNARTFPQICLTVALALSSTVAHAQNSKVPKMDAPNRLKVVAYVPNWNDTKAFAPTIDYAKITHINIAFENPTNDAGDLSFNGDDTLLIAQAHAHNVKVLVSIGGGSASGDKKLIARYDALMSDANRAAFVAKLADYVVFHKLDGLDVDLEGPAIKTDYGPFVHDLARALKAKKKLLTAALSQGYGGDQVPASVFADFDFINVMAYDATGPWDKNRPGQHSPFSLAQDNVAYWTKRGLAKPKIVLGVPFFGYGFGKAFLTRDYPFARLVKDFPGAEQTDQVGDTIWYNGIPTIKAKTKYAMETGLGGIMIWSLDSDAPGKNSLLAAIDETLRPPKATQK